MTAIPAQYRFSPWDAYLKRDWEYMLILLFLLLLGFLLMFLLATRQFFPDDEDTAQPERYARIVIGPSGGGQAGKQLKALGRPSARKVIQERTIKKVKKTVSARDRALKQSLVGVIATRSKRPNSALGKILQSGGIGDEVDSALGKVKKGKGGAGGGARGQGFQGSRGEAGTGGVGVGDIGNVGTGYGGGGDNISLGIKGNQKVQASLRSGQASIEGSLDAALIDKVVRRNLPGLKYCYEKELNKNPKLGGKIIVQFTIGLSGTITEALVESSSLNHGGVEDCILRRVRRWRFPRPEGGSVIVAYPFVFTKAS